MNRAYAYAGNVMQARFFSKGWGMEDEVLDRVNSSPHPAPPSEGDFVRGYSRNNALRAMIVSGALHQRIYRYFPER